MPSPINLFKCAAGDAPPSASVALKIWYSALRVFCLGLSCALYTDEDEKGRASRRGDAVDRPARPTEGKARASVVANWEFIGCCEDTSGGRRTSLRTSFKPSSVSESNQLAHSTRTVKYQLARRNTRNNPLAALAFLPVAGLSQPAEKKRSSRMSWHGFLLFLPPAGNCRSFAFYLESYIAYVVLYSIPRGAWPRLVAQLILPVSFNVVDPGLCACR